MTPSSLSAERFRTRRRLRSSPAGCSGEPLGRAQALAGRRSVWGHSVRRSRSASASAPLRAAVSSCRSLWQGRAWARVTRVGGAT